MSLVNEALKKARIEAARQEALDKGVPVQALPAHLPPEQRAVSPWPVIAGALALALILLLGWLAFRRPEVGASPPPRDPDNSSGSASASSPAANTQPTLDPTSQSDRVATTNPRDRRSESQPEPDSLRAAAPTARESDIDSPAKTASETEPTVAAGSLSNPLSGRQLGLPTEPLPGADTAPPSARSSPAARSDSTDRAANTTRHRLVADLPGGGQLKLAGIAWSQTSPFAVINGQMLSLGENVEGFEIVDIQPNTVTLSDGQQTLVLRSR